MWLDLRVDRRDTARAVDALLALRGAPDPYEVGEIRVDPDPPAAGPEVEISVRVNGGATQKILAHFRAQGVMVLAERLRTWDR